MKTTTTYIHNVQGPVKVQPMLDQTTSYGYPVLADSEPVDFSTQGELIHGPNYTLLSCYPYTRNVRTGEQMTNTHHCPECKSARVHGCIKNGHWGYCTAFIKIKDRWVRCGEVFGLKTDGCAIHTMPAGFNKVFQWYWLQFEQKKEDVIWSWLKVKYGEDAEGILEPIVNKKQELIEQTEKHLEAKGEQLGAIQEQDFLHNKLKQQQKIEYKDRRKAKAAVRNSKAVKKQTKNTLGDRQEPSVVAAMPDASQKGIGIERRLVESSQPDVLNRSGIMNMVKGVWSDIRTQDFKRGGAAKEWGGTRKMKAEAEAAAMAATISATPQTNTGHIVDSEGPSTDVAQPDVTFAIRKDEVDGHGELFNTDEGRNKQPIERTRGRSHGLVVPRIKTKTVGGKKTKETPL